MKAHAVTAWERFRPIETTWSNEDKAEEKLVRETLVRESAFKSTLYKFKLPVAFI